MRKDKILLAVLFLAAFIFMLPSYDKFWAPYDEGNYLEPARMVLAGFVPYRDFFIPMYPPAHTYTLAFLLKLFGINVIVARIYNIILLSSISICIFYITKKLTARLYGYISFIASVVILASLGEAPIPRSVWPAVTLNMLAVSLLINFIEKEKIGYLMISSLFIGLASLFRHDIGFLTFLPVIVGLLLFSIQKYRSGTHAIPDVLKNTIKLWFIAAIFPAISVAVLTAWLYKIDGLESAIKAYFILPAKFQQWGRIAFPQFSFNFFEIFHGGCLFIKQNKFYVPIIICATSAIFFLINISEKRKFDKKAVSELVIFILAGLYLQQLAVRVDDQHLATSFIPAAILFGVILNCSKDRWNKLSTVVKWVAIFYVSLLITLLVYKSAETYFKQIYVKPFIKKSIEPVNFGKGTLYLPDDIRESFVSLVEYVKNKTKPEDRIYIGSLRHDIPKISWFDFSLIYFLTDRLPGVEYFILIPGLQAEPEIQKEMAESLETNNVKVLLLMDFGEEAPSGELDLYIRDNYRLDKIFKPYHVYVRK